MRRWRAWRRRGERDRWWRGLGVGVAYRRGGSEKSGGARWGRGSWTWGGGGARGGARGSRSGGSGVRGGRGGALGSGSGASGWLRRGGGVGSVGARGECAVRGGSGSAAICGTGPHRSSRASQEVSAGPGGPRVVPLGTGGGGGGPPSSMDPPARGVVAAAAGGMGCKKLHFESSTLKIGYGALQLTTQAPKTLFWATKWHFLPIFGQKMRFFCDGASETLNNLLQNLAQHFVVTPAPSK